MTLFYEAAFGIYVVRILEKKQQFPCFYKFEWSKQGYYAC